MPSSYRRYSRTNLVSSIAYGTSYVIPILRENIKNGLIRFQKHTLQEGERLDILAGKTYGDSSLWWLIAACSGCGWSLQVPPGTLLTIPEISDCIRFVG